MIAESPNYYLIYKNMPLVYDVFLSPDNKYLYVGFNPIFHMVNKYRKVKSKLLKNKLKFDYQLLSIFINRKKVEYKWIGENNHHKFLIMTTLADNDFKRLKVKVQIDEHKIKFRIPKRIDTHKYQDKIGAVLLFKNENQFLPQWINYYDLFGVDFFFIYNNNPKNQYNFKLLKDKYKERVIFINWPFPYQLKKFPSFCSQLGCYHQSLYKYRNMKWIIYNDIDEYIVLRKTDKNLKEFLFNYNHHQISSLLYECMWFGCSNGRDYNEHNFLKRLIKCKGETESSKFKGTNIKYHTKSIHSPKNVISFGPHYPFKTLKPHICLSSEVIRFNHYYTLSSWGADRSKLKHNWKNHQKRENKCNCQELCQVENVEILNFRSVLKP